MDNTFGGSSDSFEQAIHLGGDDEASISADRFDDSTQQMRFGYAEQDEPTAERNAYRRVKIIQSATEQERHLVKMDPSQLEQGEYNTLNLIIVI